MYYFIVNPGSRSGNGKIIWKRVEQILEQEQVEYRVFFTSYRYHATKLAREITSRSEKLTLVSVGGDGTLNEVVDGIQNLERVTLGYIPTGSSNDFARSLSLPSKPEEALHNILHPSYFQRIDLGLMTYGSLTRRFAGNAQPLWPWQADLCRDRSEAASFVPPRSRDPHSGASEKTALFPHLFPFGPELSL